MSQSRYHRQNLLSHIDQSTLKNARVLVVGAGGLGCPALLYLVGAGTGHIGIVDNDTVELTNLHRQILFNEHDIGKKKSVCAQSHLEKLNGDINIQSITQRITSDNVEDIVQNYDIILDGTDNFQTKYILNDVCVALTKTFITGSVLRMEGQISVFENNDDSACYRCLFPEANNPPPDCNTAGVLGAVAGVVGTMQATMATAVLSGSKTHNNKLWTFDGMTGRTAQLKIPKNKKCETCSRRENIAMKKINPIEISVESIKALKNACLIDVREQDEWEEFHIDGAIFHPLSVIQGGDMPDIPSDKDVVVYCRSGQRSLYVTQILRDQGHENVVNMMGGIMAWQNAQYPVCAEK